jgi:hypothetical protein
VTPSSDLPSDDLAHDAVDRPDRRASRILRAAVAAAVGLGTTAIALAQLFLGGTAGLADNGDAHRIVCRLGLVIGPGSSQPTFEDLYTVGPTCPAGDNEYLTSWRPVFRATLWAWRQITGGTDFTIAALGVVSAVLLGAGAAALFLALPGGTRRSLPLVALLIVAACDFGFISYFNSGYSDQAGFIGLVWVCAGVVGLVTRRSWPWLLVLVAAVAFTSTAKTALITIVPAVALTLLLSRRHWAGRPVQGRWGVRRLGVVLVVAVVALAMLAGVVAKNQSKWLGEGNKFNLLFYTILAESPDPEADLREMGLPPALARYAGESAWQLDTPWGDPDLVANAGTVYSWSTYAEFLARNPDRLPGMVQTSFDAVLEARVDYLGNLPGVPGGAPRLADRPTPAFWLFDRLPQGWPVPVLLLVWLGGAGLGVRWARMGDAQRAARGVLLVLTASYAVSQSLLALSDGYYELAKHNIHAAFATGLLLALLVEAAGRTGLAALRNRAGPADRAAVSSDDAPATVVVDPAPAAR